MCGILGAIGKPFTDPRRFQLALQLLTPRGPDQWGITRYPTPSGAELAFGHRRLAILDLAARAKQPMARGRLLITYNGELWNFKDCRTKLRAAGCQFQTDSDTEVLLAAWERWGAPSANNGGCLSRLEGMYAFGLWDGRYLWLVKDRWGKCPLVYYHQRGASQRQRPLPHPFWNSIAFASERKALQFGLCVDASCCIELNPCSFLRFDPRSGELIHGAWEDKRLRFVVSGKWRGFSASRKKAAPSIGALLQRAVQMRAISDAPVCSLLSGGVDSTAIAYLATRFMPNVTAYTAVMDKRSPDVRHAEKVAAYLKPAGLRWERVVLPDLRGQALRDMLIEAIYRTELYVKAQVEIAVACYFLAQRIAYDGFKVVYSGEGSDELWGSYTWTNILRSQPREWLAARKAGIIGQHRKNFPRCNKIFLSAGVECRLPFLDRHLIAAGLTLPYRIVASRSHRKAVLIEAMRTLGADPALFQRERLAFQIGLGLRDRIREEIDAPGVWYRKQYTTLFVDGDLSILPKTVWVWAPGRGGDGWHQVPR